MPAPAQGPSALRLGLRPLRLGLRPLRLGGPAAAHGGPATAHGGPATAHGGPATAHGGPAAARRRFGVRAVREPGRDGSALSRTRLPRSALGQAGLAARRGANRALRSRASPVCRFRRCACSGPPRGRGDFRGISVASGASARDLVQMHQTREVCPIYRPALRRREAESARPVRDRQAQIVRLGPEPTARRCTAHPQSAANRRRSATAEHRPATEATARHPGSSTRTAAASTRCGPLNPHRATHRSARIQGAWSTNPALA